ncbi:hypothetical protein [Eubacterium sp.]|uniref:hypothetical protein n=1 Tax=Eubacterium sp. TaxID=142586 RepID=UPI003F023EFA
MDTGRIAEGLCTIGSVSLDEVQRYMSLIELNCAEFSDREYNEADTALLEYYVAAKTNYQISLARNEGEISSFSAGDVKVTASSGNTIQNAKALYESAYSGISHLAKDRGFCFMEV